MARNRKRAKERRARRPQPVSTSRGVREDTPDPIAHATPDVELAEAQLAIGRPDVAEAGLEPEDEEFESVEPEDEEAAEPDDDGAYAPGGTDDYDEGPPSARGGALVAAGGDGEPGRGGVAVAAPRIPIGARLVGFLQGSWRELQRVQWPDRRQVVQATGVVIGFVIVAGVFLGVADLVSQKLMNFILK